MDNLSTTEENYIKTIYHLQQADSTVSTNDVAAKLNTKAASVTDMLKRLNTKQVLNYEKYKGFSLSNEGEKVALDIVRKHRLWEYFLVEKLQFGWDEVHAIAEELEHVTSKLLIERLDNFLGNPKFDPHGDPIPDSEGKIQVQPQINLVDMPIGETAKVSAVGSQSTELLELLTHKNIAIGTPITIKKKFSFDNSLEIETHTAQTFTISRELALALFVTKKSQQ
jgi:DtxR family Mn-dependent transcriptional regulator